MPYTNEQMTDAYAEWCESVRRHYAGPAAPAGSAVEDEREGRIVALAERHKDHSGPELPAAWRVELAGVAVRVFRRSGMFWWRLESWGKGGVSRGPYKTRPRAERSAAAALRRV